MPAPTTRVQTRGSVLPPIPLPQGARLHSQEPWRPAGDNDGSTWMRPMTEEELKWQDENC